MKFDSKAHMVRELLAGKKFKDRTRNNGILYYDERLINPFQYGKEPAFGIWQMYDKDIWEEIKPQNTPIIGGPYDLCQSNVVEEVKPRNVHQDLIDSYQEGQAWQYTEPHMDGLYQDCRCHNVWVEPCWDESTIYRLHPHNAFIQAHRNGAKIQAYICGDWVEEPHPDWYEDTQYRVKPATKTVYEWMSKNQLDGAWVTTSLLMSEEEAKRHFIGYEYQKTGRSWEIET
jgi:hypothetical protein